jgi:(E)-4-hydroxy-3-methylbut-2-enyl-diphosphate synthase
MALGETAPVFVDGKKAALRGPTLADDFKKMLVEYIERRYGVGAGRAAE